MPNIRLFIKTYQNLVISGVILIFCVVGVIAGVVPAAGKIREMGSSMQELSEEYTRLQAKLSILNSLDENTLRNQLGAVISAVPTDKSLPTIFSTTEAIAAQSTVSIISMNILGDTDLASGSAKKTTALEKQIGTHAIPFAVTIEGPLPAIQDFITVAPQVRRLFRVRTFAITFPQNDRPISIAVQMDAFYEPSPTDIGKSSTTLTTLTEAESGIVARVSELPLANVNETALPPPAVGAVGKENPFSP